MKTREEVHALKENWLGDPCYDLWSVEGFEEYEDELRIFAGKQEIKWKKAYEETILKKARELGCDGNMKIAKHVIWLEDRICNLEEKLNRG